MGVQRVSTGAQRPIGRSTSAAARPPVGLLQLQRAAGNAAVAGLIAARQVVTAPTAPTRPIFRLGDIDQQVGVAQQKLNVLGATPELKIDAGRKAIQPVGNGAERQARQRLVGLAVDRHIGVGLGNPQRRAILANDGRREGKAG